jgi:hypothetical protein
MASTVSNVMLMTPKPSSRESSGWMGMGHTVPAGVDG